jgi:MoxR-like ATPase
MLAGMEGTAKSLFAESVAAYEGLEIGLQSPSPLPLSHREKGMEAVQYAQNG